MGARLFTALKSKPIRRRVLAFDCEGIGGMGGFLCGSTVSDDHTFFFTSPKAMLDYLTSYENEHRFLFAHNLEYDLSVLTGGDFTGWTLTYIDARLLRAEYTNKHGGKHHFLDSRNLFPGFTVAQLGAMLGTPKMELSRALMDKISAGCRWLDFDLFQQNEIRSYNVRDSIIVKVAVDWLQDELAGLGGQLCETIAGCAMDVFRRAYQKRSWLTPDIGINAWCRQSYYGARTEPYRVGVVQDVLGYDYNSLYPWVQGHIKFPHPDHLTIDPQPDKFSSYDRYEGLAQVTVDVRETHMPVLPMRAQKKLFFPTGRLTGCWPLHELRYALEHGASLVHFDWIAYSTSSFNPFSEFISALYERRLSYKHAEDRREKVIKLLLNASYGRYGIHADGRLQQLVPWDPEQPPERYAGGQVRVMADVPYVLLPVGIDQQPLYACSIIAAYIAAGARIQLHRAMTLAGETTCYVDTDSVMCRKPLPVGAGLGELKLEYQGREATIVGPKEYALDLHSDQPLVHVKGIPLSQGVDYIDTGHVTFTRPVSVREALQHNDVPGRWKATSRTRVYSAPKRALLAPDLPDPGWQPTRAWTWAELCRPQGPES